jgi:hypothetical protein
MLPYLSVSLGFNWLFAAIALKLIAEFNRQRKKPLIAQGLLQAKSEE